MSRLVSCLSLFFLHSTIVLALYISSGRTTRGMSNFASASSEDLGSLIKQALGAHQQGELDAALAGYEKVIPLLGYVQHFVGMTNAVATASFIDTIEPSNVLVVCYNDSCL